MSSKEALQAEIQRLRALAFREELVHSAADSQLREHARAADAAARGWELRYRKLEADIVSVLAEASAVPANGHVNVVAQLRELVRRIP